MTTTLTADSNLRVLTANDPEPVEGSVVMTQSTSGTVWQRFYSDGQWHCVTGAVATDPERFGAWLKPGGRLFVIHGQSPVQEALRITRRGEGFHRESLFETDVPYLHGAAPAPHFSF